MRPWAVFASLFLALTFPASADPGERWEPVGERDGVRMSRLMDPKGLPVSRAEVEIEADLSEVLAVLGDAPRRVEWMSRCIESRDLEELEDGGAISYTRTRGLWPVADRDSVVRSRVSIAPDGESARVRLDSTETPLAPEVDGVVRIPALEAEYRLRALEPGRTRVEYRNFVDLGGRVPGFVQRFVRDDMPFETVRGLRAQVERTQGEYAAAARALRRQEPGRAAVLPATAR